MTQQNVTVADVAREYDTMTRSYARRHGRPMPYDTVGNREIIFGALVQNGNNPLSLSDLSNLRGVLGLCYAGRAHEVNECTIDCDIISRGIYRVTPDYHPHEVRLV